MSFSMIGDSENDDCRSSAESSEGFSFASAKSLSRNLTEAFDKQVEVSKRQSSLSEGLSISERISQYEHATAHHHQHPHPHPHPQYASKPPMIPNRNQIHNNNPIPNDKFAVYLRIRPPSSYSKDKKQPPANNTIEILPHKNSQMNPTTVRTYPPVNSNTSKFNLKRDMHGPSSCAKEFDFQQVLGPETTQQDLYSVVAAPLIQALFHSSKKQRSALCLSYGVSNSGKTHSILGNTKSNDDSKWGVIPRAIAEVVNQIKIRSQATGDSQLYISCFEVYNEQIYDLLPRKTGAARIGPPPVLKVRESRGQILVRGLAKHKVTNVSEGVDLTHMANSRRHTSSNNLNEGSSRSHFICQMQIIPSSKHAEPDSVASKSGYSTDEEASWTQNNDISTIWIVDLAGSERSKRTGMGSSRQKEASLINKSLLTLMRCLTVMREQNGRHGSATVIPFRESKLTHLFMRHLTGPSASRTAMIVNVNPSIADFDETQHVLAYASKAKTIQIKPEELTKKRKHYFGDEYDMNGRKKTRSVTEMGKKLFTKTGQSSKKVVRKLSPKKMFSGSVKSISNSMIIEQKNKPFQESNVSKLSAEVSSKEEEIKSLKKSLNRAKMEIENLKMENTTLVEDLQNQERQIRMEVSEEIEERFTLIRTRNNEEIERLKSKLRMNPSLCRSTKKAHIDQAESQIQDLMDKVDECEEEMVRLREEHAEEVADWKNQIQKLETENSGSSNGTSSSSTSKRIAFLENELASSQHQVSRLERSKKELIENYETLLNDGDEEEDEEESDSENLVHVVHKACFSATSKPSTRRPLGSVTGNIPNQKIGLKSNESTIQRGHRVRSNLSQHAKNK